MLLSVGILTFKAADADDAPRNAPECAGKCSESLEEGARVLKSCGLECCCEAFDIRRILFPLVFECCSDGGGPGKSCGVRMNPVTGFWEPFCKFFPATGGDNVPVDGLPISDPPPGDESP